MTRNSKIGIILILAGIVLLLSQLGLIPGLSFLFLLGFGFIAAYIILGGRKEYSYVGFLIPGVILVAVATFAALEETAGPEGVNPGLFFILLGLSFLAVFLIHTYWFKGPDQGNRFWPLFPAGGLLLFGVFIGAVTTERWTEYLDLLNYIWVVALIAVGVWLMISSIRSSKK